MRYRVVLLSLFALFVLGTGFFVLPAQAQDEDFSDSGTNSSDSSSDDDAITDSRQVATRCVKAQTKLREVQAQAKDATTKRTTLYRNFDGRLWVVIGKLKLADQDTTELETARSELIASSEKFNELSTAYLETLGTLTQSGCQDDPDGFVSNLATAREQLTALRAHNAETRTIVTETIKGAISERTGVGSANTDPFANDGSSE
jgi:hypothetical protein